LSLAAIGGPGVGNVIVEGAGGMVVLEVVDDLITLVEVLDRRRGEEASASGPDQLTPGAGPRRVS
jgi:hypothetical protein